MADDNATEGGWRYVDISSALNINVNTIASIRKKFVLAETKPALLRKPRSSPPNPLLAHPAKSLFQNLIRSNLFNQGLQMFTPESVALC